MSFVFCVFTILWEEKKVSAILSVLFAGAEKNFAVQVTLFLLFWVSIWFFSFCVTVAGWGGACRQVFIQHTVQAPDVDDLGHTWVLSFILPLRLSQTLWSNIGIFPVYFILFKFSNGKFRSARMALPIGRVHYSTIAPVTSCETFFFLLLLKLWFRPVERDQLSRL